VLLMGLGVAVLCAVATNVAFLCRHRGASSVPTVEWQHPWATSKALWGARWFAIGMGVALVAWLLHVAALAVAPITLVQVAISAGLVLVAVLAERWFGISVGRRQWIAVVLTAVGLALVTASTPTPKSAHSAYSPGGMLAFQAVVIGGAALCMASRRMASGARYAIVLGAAAGALFAGSDAALKALSKHVGDHGPGGLLTPWLVTCVLCSVMGFFASARSLQDDDAVAVISLTTVGSTVATLVGGIVVFRDPVATQPHMLALQLGGFVCICLAAALIPAPVRAAAPADVTRRPSAATASPRSGATAPVA
jgi:drug/metabolite transporter (DMT)-like permease